MQARWADASGIERVPLVSALAKPFVFFARRPAAEGAADARGAGVLFFLKLAVWNCRKSEHISTRLMGASFREDGIMHSDDSIWEPFGRE
jgi:hypothetical protein